ncbi:MAG: DUF2156 domain-containing protein [Blautia sp.]|nr:DUF2156 domain-containing protein [Blautia sp.]
MFTWKVEYGLTIAGDEDFFVIRSIANEGYFAPCGDQEKCKEFLEETFRREGKIRVLYVTEEMAERSKLLGFRVKKMPELSEYICSTEALALKKGHISHTFRRKCAKFKEEFPYKPEVIREKDIPELLDIIAAWEKDVPVTGALDLSAARLSLENFMALGLSGIVVHTRDGVAAFSFGFRSAPDTYTMSTVKYDKRLSPSVTFVCTHEEAKLVACPYRYCNLEEDLGLPGLRASKLQCSPVKMQEVYTIEK